MLHFSLVHENAIGDCTELLRGVLDEQHMAGFLLAMRRVNDYLPSLRLVIGQHTITRLVIKGDGSFTVQGEPVPNVQP